MKETGFPEYFNALVEGKEQRKRPIGEANRQMNFPYTVTTMKKRGYHIGQVA
jgi:hypothetical protein